MRNTFAKIGLTSVLALLFLWAPGVEAQGAIEWDGGREQMTRVELEELMERIQENLASTAYSQQLRGQLERNAQLIQRRLDQGDFQVGDRIVFQVEGEPEMSDTLVVRSGQRVSIPLVGDLSLQGALRSELEEHLAEHVAQYVREPRVRAQSLIRISVLGEVEAPGFYVVPAEFLVTDVLMAAGGPTREAKLQDLRVERGDERIWAGELLQEAVIQGRTLDHLNIQAGDRIFVPLEVRRTGWETFQVIAASAGALGSLAVLVTLFF